MRPNRPLRVAHILPFTGVGGTELATLRLIRAVEPLGVRSVAFCRPDAGDVAALFRDAGVPVRTWRPRAPDIGRKSNWMGVADVALGLLRQRAHLVHCADVAAATWQVVTAARAARLPLVCHIRNRNPRLPQHIEGSLAHVARFVFMSRETWRVFAHDVPEERGTVVYDGVEVDPAGERPGERARARAALLSELGLPEDAELCCMVARVEPQKDFATFARAAARVVAERPRARFLVIGGYDRTPEQRDHMPLVRRWIADAGVAEHVHFLGFREDVARLMLACDVALLVTHWEGLPLVLWEAMAAGTPVVATAVDGVPEAITDGVNGYLVAHGADDEVASRVLELLRDAARRAELGRAGREFVRHAFSRERFATTMASFYIDVAARRARSVAGLFARPHGSLRG